MSSKFRIAGNVTQINFRYKCKNDFIAVTTEGKEHTFKEKTILRIDELGENYAILTYTTFPQKAKIQLKITSDFEHLDKLTNFNYS